MGTEHLEQTAVVLVVNAIKASHVTRRRGRVVRDVTQDTRGPTAMNVKYLLASIQCLLLMGINETFYMIIYLYDI